MNDLIFSKEVIKLLDENGYSVKQDDQSVIFTHSNFEHVFFLFIGLFLVLISFVFLLKSPWLGSALLIGAIIVISKAMNGTRGKSALNLNFTDLKLTYKYNGKSVVRSFERIIEISCYSVFANEYASATKSTSEEYHHQIKIKLTDHQELELFLLKSDHLEPSLPINQLIEDIKSILKKAKYTS